MARGNTTASGGGVPNLNQSGAASVWDGYTNTFQHVGDRVEMNANSGSLDGGSFTIEVTYYDFEAGTEETLTLSGSTGSTGDYGDAQTLSKFVEFRGYEVTATNEPGPSSFRSQSMSIDLAPIAPHTHG